MSASSFIAPPHANQLESHEVPVPVQQKQRRNDLAHDRHYMVRKDLL